MNEALKQRAAIAAAAVLVIAAVIGVAVVAGDDEDDVALPSPTASAGSTTGPDATSRSAGETDAPADRTAGPTIASATPASAADVRPGDARPPKAGAYRYRQTIDDERTESTLRITDLGSMRQREASDDGFTSETRWREDGKFIEKTTFGASDAPECEWDPPTRELKLPLVDGSSWQILGRCAAGPGVTITFTGTTEVTGAARATVGGRRVDVWLMRSEVTLTTKSPQGSSEQTVSSDDQFSPEYGVYVRSVEESEGTDPRTGRETTQRSTQELISLTPS
jgi:hypothetical protein